MFTGLIESVGKLTSLETKGNYQVLTITPDKLFDKLSLGESIACDGVCLTVISFDKKSFRLEASQETISCTILKNYKSGRSINLERALQVGQRLGGHFVSGHVDTVGQIKKITQAGHSIIISLKYDPEHSKLVISKGSIAINGISLTVNKCSDGNLEVNIIPHSADNTNLTDLKQNDEVNLEFDMLGKYVVQMLNGTKTKKKKKSLTIDKLTESGW